MRSCVYYAIHILVSWSEELKKKFQLREIGQIGTLQENMVMFFYCCWVIIILVVNLTSFMFYLSYWVSLPQIVLGIIIIKILSIIIMLYIIIKTIKNYVVVSPSAKLDCLNSIFANIVFLNQHYLLCHNNGVNVLCLVMMWFILCKTLLVDKSWFQ